MVGRSQNYILRIVRVTSARSNGMFPRHTSSSWNTSSRPIRITAGVPFSPDNAFQAPELDLKLLGVMKVLGDFRGVEAE